MFAFNSMAVIREKKSDKIHQIKSTSNNAKEGNNMAFLIQRREKLQLTPYSFDWKSCPFLLSLCEKFLVIYF